MKNWQEIADRIIRKERETARRNRDRIPYTTEPPHRFNDYSAPDRIGWWTNGFWGGILWQLYAATGEDTFRDEAEHVQHRVESVLLDAGSMDHDSGFRFLLTSVADYRLTGNADSAGKGILAATNLAGRFHPKGRWIRAWNDPPGNDRTAGWAIIDCMMNLPLLFWASEYLADPRFAQIAMAHADTAARYFIREDGSARHIVAFDPVTGGFLRELGGQGMGEGTSWTRGQAWALYGFSLCYRHSGDPAHLEIAKRIADRWIDRMPEGKLLPVDFDQPEGDALYDSSAAAIASCGLIELAEHLKEDPACSDRYLAAAEAMLTVLDAQDADYDPEHDEILRNCSVDYHGEAHNIPLVYGDYFYMEAILRLTGQAAFLW